MSLSPVTPTFSRKMYSQLGFTDEQFDGLDWEKDVKWGGLKEGHRVTSSPFPIFGRQDDIAWVTEVTEVSKTVKKESGGSGKGGKGKVKTAD